MSKKMLVPLAEGFEEIELINIVDLLRRTGVEVVLASLSADLLVSGAHQIQIKADSSLEAVLGQEFDGIALAGGFNGMQNLKADKRILELCKNFKAKNKLVSAICASPMVLNEAGVLEGEFTCYPSCEVGLKGDYVKKDFVRKDNVITGAGVGVASDFALALVEYLCGKEARDNLAGEILLSWRKA